MNLIHIMPLGTVTWSVNPELFSIGFLTIRWYSLLLATGFFFAYCTLSLIFKKEHIPQTVLDKFSIWTIVWTIVGLRLAHFLFYEPEYFITNPLQVFLPFDENWNFTGFQGLASHGAVIAIILFVIYFTWKRKINFFWLIDRLAITIPIAATMVRIGNLMNHEIVGSITNVPWAFNFTMGGQGIANTFRHPAQLYEAAIYLTLFIGLVIYYFKFSKTKIPPGLTTGILLVVVFTARFIIEFFKEIQVARESGMALDIGQRLSIPFILIGIGFLIYAITHRHKIPHFVQPKC